MHAQTLESQGWEIRTGLFRAQCRVEQLWGWTINWIHLSVHHEGLRTILILKNKPILGISSCGKSSLIILSPITFVLFKEHWKHRGDIKTLDASEGVHKSSWDFIHVKYRVSYKMKIILREKMITKVNSIYTKYEICCILFLQTSNKVYSYNIWELFSTWFQFLNVFMKK